MDLLNMFYDRNEIEKSIEAAKLTIQRLQHQLKNVVPKCKRRLTFEDTTCTAQEEVWKKTVARDPLISL